MEKEEIRLQKYIAQTGLASRRKAEEYIEKGYILVDGKVATIGMKVTNENVVEYVQKNGKKRLLSKEEKEYYLLNKPLGYVCTSYEQFNRPKVIDIIKSNNRLVTVGRLDMYTTGAILVTNDGELVNSLTHPKNEIEKEYTVTIKGEIQKEDLDKLEKGIEIENYITAPAKTKILKIDNDKNISRVRVKIHEGKNREVRKMFKTLGYSVIALHRNMFAGLEVSNLKPGEYIQLSKKDILKLKELI